VRPQRTWISGSPAGESEPIGKRIVERITERFVERNVATAE
jgi:hypothetical protein